MRPDVEIGSATIYKICSRESWDDACRLGRYPGSADDRRDGFIHFSARHQLAATAEKYFKGQADLVLIAVEAARLGTSLRWEPSRGGDLFPHLYKDLETRAALSVMPLPLDDQGHPLIPEGLV
ncbi:MAG: DUF952 domain-containing protein [Hyphomicrobium sp.]|nr:DUF952 domain-containing protein [Hyphomicrobium sp.]PPC83015.1 MAG: dihydroorotate dehydrogenase [Hyphomicrobium sp.]